MRPRLTNILLLGAALAAGMLLARRLLIRRIEGPARPLLTGPWPPAGGEPDRSPTETIRTSPEEQGSRGKPSAGTAAVKATGTDPWVGPTDSQRCPEAYPVKVKLTSRLYHLPGMLAYDRTHPDRCYPSPEAAETDGFTRAKR